MHDMLPWIVQEIAVNPTTMRSRRPFPFIILYVEYISKCKACLTFYRHLKELMSFNDVCIVCFTK